MRACVRACVCVHVYIVHVPYLTKPLDKGFRIQQCVIITPHLVYYRFDAATNKVVTRNILREVQADIPNIKEEEVLGKPQVILAVSVNNAHQIYSQASLPL